ncbi:bifunctional DNA primase/polymerase [Streptomyces sp. JJ36]|nr:bifunctional DNA primase/polymerase [Streptomyces sp. JJ36]
MSATDPADPSASPQPATNPASPASQDPAPSRSPAEAGNSAGRPARRCTCADPECPVPGAHPVDPVLLAATTDARMVRWWWTERPDASLLLATGATADGRRSPCALSLPAAAGRRALDDFDRLGVRLGPVLATPTRCALLVQPYELPELGELLYAQDWVPSSLRFHGDGGYVPLPPTATGSGQVHWERRPVVDPGRHTPWLPRMETLLDVLVEASAATPDTGSRLAY